MDKSLKRTNNLLEKSNKDLDNSDKREKVSKPKSTTSWKLRENRRNSKPRRRRKELRRPSKRESNKKPNKRRETLSIDKRTWKEPTPKSRLSTRKLLIPKKKLKRRER